MPLRDKTQKRYSGVLLAVSSLPSNYGIGSFGIEAYKFIDFLSKSKQRFWQILPLNPLGEGDSPYKSVSTFAGEMLYIDLDFLVRDGLLKEWDIKPRQFSQNPGGILCIPTGKRFLRHICLHSWISFLSFP